MFFRIFRPATPRFLSWTGLLRGALFFIIFLFMTRVSFYVDGFNFAFGIKRAYEANAKWGCAFWIDLVKLFENFVGEDQILDKVVYFTSTPLDSDNAKKQGAFLNANRELNGDRFEVVRGSFLAKTIKCGKCGNEIPKPEEKKTDVNISVRMIGDCVKGLVDSVVLVSADTDLIPPLEFVLDNFKDVKTKVYFPPTNSSRDIVDLGRSKGFKVKDLASNANIFYRAQMPEKVGLHTIPDDWRRRLAGSKPYFETPKLNK